MRRALGFLLALVSLGCAHGGPRSLESPAEPNLDGVVQLFGRFGIASACPFADGRYALTAAHVVDVRPFENIGLYGARWSDGYGNSGTVDPVLVFTECDLAIVERTDGKPWANPYPLAPAPPEAGEHIYIRGYDNSSRKKAYAPKTTRGTVIRRVADHLVLDEDSARGSSGGCVLNERGEITSAVAWGPEMPDGPIGVAPGVWTSAEYFWESYEVKLAEQRALLEQLKRLNGEAEPSR